MCSKSHVSFENYERQLKIPFIIYVHFDALQVPARSKTKILHKPCGFGYSVKCWYNESYCKYEEYMGEDSPRVLWQKLENEVKAISDILNIKADPQVLNDEAYLQFQKLRTCHFCGKDLGEDKCQDYCPLTGQFLGAAHKKCREKRKVPFYIPVVMNNLSKYGSHFLLKELSKSERDKTVFMVGKDQGFLKRYPNLYTLRFIGMNLFMDAKIEDLEEILSDTKKQRLKKEFKKKTLFELMKKKNYFPYRHVNSFDKFWESKLPTEKGFFDLLHDEEISEDAYQRCKDIWTRFSCKTIGDYFRIYVKSNVFLLEDIFENFRRLCLDKYNLDPAHYFTIASFSWDSMLRYTGVTLELLQDKNMINFIRGNIRGGITQCGKRHAQANNIHCNYDKGKPSTFIVYLDANNLGGWAMSQNLPFSDFRWLTEKEIKTININKLDDDDTHGYFFEVDLDYPKNLHRSHSDLPFCLQHIRMNNSAYAVEKPVLTFFHKEKYGIDYRTLKQCLQNGLVLKKIHRVLKFRQCKWLEPYITYNTTLRAKAHNDFEIKLYKLLNNSVFGKTIQKTSNDKPIHAGFSILELSKRFMYDFHYKVMVPKYPNKINLLYIDTDGVIYEIQTADWFQDLKSDQKLRKMMDTSNLDPRWGIPPKHKKAVGKMKHEYDGKVIREFFGAGAKVYFLDVEGEEIKKAVGVKTYVKQKHVHRSDFESCVLHDKKISRAFWETSSEEHEVQSTKKTQTVLSPGDRKRRVLEDKINTLAWGYEDNESNMFI